MPKITSKYEQLMNRLKAEGRVHEVSEEESNKIYTNIEQEVEAFRMENNKRLIESQREINGVILTH